MTLIMKNFGKLAHGFDSGCVTLKTKAEETNMFRHELPNKTAESSQESQKTRKANVNGKQAWSTESITILLPPFN